MALRIPAAAAEAAISYLWEREMVGGVYDFRPVRVRSASGAVDAHAFTVRRCHAGYAGRLSTEETARLILQGIGGGRRGRAHPSPPTPPPAPRAAVDPPPPHALTARPG